MYVKICDICKQMIPENIDGDIRIKAKKSIIRSKVLVYDITVPEKLYEGIDICPRCVREIASRIKEDEG